MDIQLPNLELTKSPPPHTTALTVTALILANEPKEARVTILFKYVSVFFPQQNFVSIASPNPGATPRLTQICLP